MSIGARVFVALSVLSLGTGCGKGAETALQIPSPHPAGSQDPIASHDSGPTDPTPTCPPARGEGTVPPAFSIYSITFVVNGFEHVVLNDDTLSALPGDEVQVSEVTICAGPFSSNGGETCVDFAPVTQDGLDILSEHRGTHTLRVTPGFTSISGLDYRWTIGENWSHISVVLNHWPPEGTEDLDCGSGCCERDDRIVVWFR